MTTGKKNRILYLWFSSLFDQFVTFSFGLRNTTRRLDCVLTFRRQGNIVLKNVVQHPGFLFKVISLLVSSSLFDVPIELFFTLLFC